MNCSMPGLPAHHQLPESTQTHVHPVGDAIQPSHPLLPSSLPAPNLSQHQGLSQGVGTSHQVAEVLELQLQQFTEPSERGHDYPHIPDVEKKGEREELPCSRSQQRLEPYPPLHVASWPKVGAK